VLPKEETQRESIPKSDQRKDKGWRITAKREKSNKREGGMVGI